MELIRLKFNYAYVSNLIEQEVIEDINIVIPIMGGLMLLHIAAFNNDQKLVDYLLHKEADVNSKSQYWGTALHVAVIMENLSIIESLIKCGADVNTQLIADSGLIHFRYAAEENHEEIPEFLLKNDANVSATLNTYDFCFGKLPLQIVVDRSNEEMVELLLKNNADPNLDARIFETPLICAAKLCGEVLY
ncbi:putative ankyrin repeat protein RF_0381 [Microplitis demolitor]|uniref:putative ankyrin repeat protein RF_0381 n=1 Tax=Microplitis demolitor TaxID=69319 RepID=UPI00235B5C6E|nr:putative ankyrin repeat protein RF_0381 [Microplitis demolitor]